MNDDSQGKSIEERIAQATTPDTAGEPSVETEENQPEPMPSSDQKQTEEVKEPEPAPDQSSEDDLTLPEGVTERTRQQFDKLKARLAEAESRAKHSQASDFGDSVFDSFRPQQTVSQNLPGQETYGFLNQQQVDSITSQFVDADGNVDINGLNQALALSNQKAAQAEQRAKSVEDKLERLEETQQVKEAHAVHPQLDPGNKESFDPTFFELVRDRLLRNMYEGKKQSLLEVANDLSKAYKTTSPVNLDKVKEEAVTQYKQTQESRNQGPIETGKGEDRNPLANLEELRKQTRSENPLRPTPALDERLRAAGILKS